MAQTKIEVKKTKQGLQLIQKQTFDNGQSHSQESEYLKPAEIEDRLWQLAKFNRIAKEETAKKLQEDLQNIDDLFDSIVKELVEVAGVKDYQEYKNRKAVEYLEGVWKYRVDSLGNHKEQKGSLVIADGIVSGVTNAKLRGTVEAEDEISFSFKKVFESGSPVTIQTVIDRKRQNGQIHYKLTGWLSDGREVMLERG